MGGDDADGLQIRVSDGGADKFHAALLQVARDSVEKRRASETVFADDGTAAPAPEVNGECLIFFLKGAENLCVRHGSANFLAITDDIGNAGLRALSRDFQ